MKMASVFNFLVKKIPLIKTKMIKMLQIKKSKAINNHFKYNNRINNLNNSNNQYNYNNNNNNNNKYNNNNNSK